jgi:hypothetical protein
MCDGNYTCLQTDIFSHNVLKCIILNFETQQAKNNTEVSLQDDDEEIEIPTYELKTLFPNLKETKPHDLTVLHLS